MNSAKPNRTDLPESQRDTSEVAVESNSGNSASTNFGIFGAGLRAFWGVALFLLVWELLRYSVLPLFALLFRMPPFQGGLIPPGTQFVYEGGALFCVAAPTWLMARVEGRSASTYGFAPQRRLRNFCKGICTGAMLLSLLVILLRASGLLIFDGRALFGRDILRYGLIWAGGFLLVALAEEVFLRGYLQFALTRGVSVLYRGLFGTSHADAAGFWIAAAVLSCAFGFSHAANPDESPLGLLSAALVGLLFCLSLWRTGSLWWAIGFHASWDWAQSFLYGVADSGLMVKGHLFATHPVGRPYLSGGLTGPEGSLYLLPVMLAGAAVILFTLPRTNFGYRTANAPEASLH
jgi:membrane protease YdiL (CAAX protease family)